MSRNILNNNGVYVNTILPGDGLNLTSSGTSQTTMNVDISKQGAVTSMSNSDVFILEQTSGDIKKISGSHLKNSLTAFTVTEPLQKTGDNVKIKGLEGFTANKILKVNSQGNAIEYADDENTEYTAGTNLILSVGNEFSLNSTITGNITFNGTPTINNFIELKGQSGQVGYINFYDTGTTNNISLLPPTNVIGSLNVNLPSSAGTIALQDEIFFNRSTNEVSMKSNSYNLLLGATSNSNSRKLLVVGDSEIQGDLYVQLNKKLISSNDSNDYLQFGNNTFINNYTSNVFTNGISFGAGADLTLATGRSISRATDSNDRITFNDGNTRLGNVLIVDNSILIAATTNTDSRKLLVEGTSEFRGVIFSKGASGVPGYINIYDTDKLHHTSLYPTENVNVNVYLPNLSDTLVGRITTDTLQNKTLKLPKISDTSDNHNYIFSVNELTADRTITLPLLTGNDEFVFKNHLQTLTNKTITGAFTGALTGNADTATKIASITNSNIVQLTTNQTLTNKSLTSPTVTGTPVFDATIRLNGDSGAAGQVDFFDVDDLLKISLVGQPNLISDHVLTLPAQTGTLSTTTDIQTALNVSTTSDSSNTIRTFGNSSCVAKVNGASFSVPTSINVTPSGLDEGVLIRYDSGLAGGNGGMIFGSNSISANNGWETGIQAKQFIKFKCGSTEIAEFAVSPAGVKTNKLKGATDVEDTLIVGNGFISGEGDYLKWVTYETNYRALESFCVVPSAPAAQGTTHFLLKNGQSYFASIKQNTAGSLFFHFENNGDRFTISKDWDFGHAHAKFNYDGSAYTWLYDPSGTNAATSFAGSYMGWHNNGSAIYLNTPGGGTSAGDYIGFATANVPKGRMEMTGNFFITGTLYQGHTFSDERVKENIKDYDNNATELLNKLKIKSFNRKIFDNYKADDNGILLPFAQRFSDKTYYDIGLIAQDLLKIPELEFLVENQDGGDIEPMSIPDWNPLTALCIKSIQEQQVQINELKTLINTLL